MDKCILNLANLCVEVASTNDYIEIIDKDDFFYCKNGRDIWPNYFIYKRENFDIESVKGLLKSEVKQPFILAPYAILDDSNMRNNGFFPVESWINMGKELILNQMQVELSANVSVNYVKTEVELNSWFDLVNLNLFRSLLTTHLITTGIKRNNFKYLFAKINKQIVGTAMVYCEYTEKSAGIYMLSVSQEFRNNKIGTSILSALEAVLLGEGFEHLYLQSTRMGIHLYEKFGFQKFEKYYLYKLNVKNEQK